jgi:phospholipid-binding lipoprotein MlaA
MTGSSRRASPGLLALSLALCLAGCATTAAILPPEEPAIHVVSEFSDDDYVARAPDPWEGFNQRMYKFNYHFDKYVFLPIVSGYEFITPTVVQDGVTHFFNNVGEVRTLYNSLFQLKAEKSLITLGRFVTNTTLGIGGLFDPATSFGLQQQKEDFGQTLGVWGVGTGPYLVLPILGPNTVRSATGFAVDAGIRYAILSAIGPFDNIQGGTGIQAGISSLEAIDLRHKEKFRYYESGNPFEYYMVRFLYREKRELAIGE